MVFYPTISPAPIWKYRVAGLQGGREEGQGQVVVEAGAGKRRGRG